MILYGSRQWCGETRKRYNFNILFTDNNIPAKGGVYIFVKRRFVFWFEALYVGKAVNLKSRIGKHERWKEAFWRCGATEKHILLIDNENRRRMVEEDLIRHLKPAMNKMLSPSSKNVAPKNEKLFRQWARRSYWKK